MANRRILHITPHMGGGVGNAVSGIVSSCEASVLQKIIVLEMPVHLHFLDIVKSRGIKVSIRPDRDIIEKWIEKSDVIIIHWWHHPKTAAFLYDFPQAAVRLVLWTHISSLTVPALHPQMLQESSMVWFTTPASYKAEGFAAVPEKVIEEKTGVVYGCAGLDHFPDLRRNEHEGFHIGYLGYVDFSKLHPDFILFCKEVRIPEARFILAGDAPAQEFLEMQAKEQEVKNEFVYPGYVTDIHGVLSDFDVFGYPLMPFHTCTTENAILEAMAAKVPPVVLNQLSEKYLVRDGETGILVSGKEEYGNAMRYLFRHPEERRRMGIKARDYVIKEYSRKKISDSFYSNVEIAMKQPKKKVNFKTVMGRTPAEWFLSCLGQDAYKFRQSFTAGPGGQTSEIRKSILDCSPLLKGENKSSVFHYAREFPEDPILRLWAKMMKEESEKDG